MALKCKEDLYHYPRPHTYPVEEIAVISSVEYHTFAAIPAKCGISRSQCVVPQAPDLELYTSETSLENSLSLQRDFDIPPLKTHLIHSAQQFGHDMIAI